MKISIVKLRPDLIYLHDYNITIDFSKFDILLLLDFLIDIYNGTYKIEYPVIEDIKDEIDFSDFIIPNTLISNTPISNTHVKPDFNVKLNSAFNHHMKSANEISIIINNLTNSKKHYYNITNTICPLNPSSEKWVSDLKYNILYEYHILNAIHVLTQLL
jgi:hypothetical protein